MSSLILLDGDEILKEVGVAASQSSRLAPANIEGTMRGKVGEDNSQQISTAHFDQQKVIDFGCVPIEVYMRATAYLLCI